MVMGSEQYIALEVDQAIVHCCNGFQIQMVGRLVYHQNIGAEQHHACQHAAYLFTTGQDIYRLINIIAGKQHLAQEGTQGGFQRIGLGIGRKPVQHAFGVTVEKFRVILGEIGLAGGNTPFEGAFIRLHFTHKNLEQRGSRLLGFAHKGNLIAAGHTERNIVQNLFPVNGLGNALDLQNILARFTVHLEAHKRIPAGGSRQLVNGQLVNQLFTAGCLLGFGFICREPADKFL